MTESLAIMNYLAIKGKREDLLGMEGRDRYRVDELKHLLDDV